MAPGDTACDGSAPRLVQPIEPIEAALELVLDKWRTEHDRRRLRRELVRMLAELDD